MFNVQSSMFKVQCSMFNVHSNVPPLSWVWWDYCRVRYFTDGAVIGSKGFVNDAFANARKRFGERRKDGARRLRGAAAPAAGSLWSLRDLKKGIG
jgi:hypothetical protein